LGEDVQVGSGAAIERSVVLAGAQIGVGCVLRDSIVAERAKIGSYVELEEGVVVGEDARIAARRVVAAGTRVAAGESV
jgi:NDP-sugar pyrophosphorylase family protein